MRPTFGWLHVCGPHWKQVKLKIERLSRECLFIERASVAYRYLAMFFVEWTGLENTGQNTNKLSRIVLCPRVMCFPQFMCTYCSLYPFDCIFSLETFFISDFCSLSLHLRTVTCILLLSLLFFDHLELSRSRRQKSRTFKLMGTFHKTHWTSIWW